MNRQLNTPSPVVFPSASPTPKLLSTPSKKLPSVRAWQDNFEIEYDHEQALQQLSYVNHENPVHSFHTAVESENSLDDIETSSQRFGQDEYLSSAVSSSGQCSPVNMSRTLRRPVSYTCPSPLQQQKQRIIEENDEKPIVGVPFKPTQTVDPIYERMPIRRCSYNGSPSREVKVNTTATRKFSSLISRLKKPFFK
ncbi:hypothetical protein [Parasitella parasitica]|uniref:Uncharacterized protein n=1 Tax=Parasitella parasitica TaxID=35722 RepID=A0A0B7NT13_9FUNG|nr:hypothetical protein [Parasitella parasitica]